MILVVVLDVLAVYVELLLCPLWVEAVSSGSGVVECSVVSRWPSPVIPGSNVRMCDPGDPGKNVRLISVGRKERCYGVAFEGVRDVDM